MNTISQLRDTFPTLKREFYGKPLVYLDSAATSQKPQAVIDLVNDMNTGVNANVHRAMYSLADEATVIYEGARDTVKEFINSPQRESIIFTSGTTAAINLVASSFCSAFVKEDDVIIVSEDSHHSNIVPWQLACSKVGGALRVLPVKESGEWDLDILQSLIDSKVKLIAVPHISNVLGIINPIESVIKIAKERGVATLIDGAQGIVHCNVDVQALDCDFYVFSAHKIFGATGVGVLYGKQDILDKIPPYMGGGDMVDTVTFEQTTYAPLPLKFEAGTPNFIGAGSLTPALNLAKELKIGEIGEEIKQEEERIVEYMVKELKEIEGVQLFGLPADLSKKIPLFSISVDGCNPGDIAQILDKMGIAVRSGMMCAEPLMRRFGVTAMLRISFAPYNTLAEAEYFIKCLKRAVAMLK